MPSNGPRLETGSLPTAQPPFCHRFQIPFSMAVQKPGPIPSIQVQQQMGYVPCVREKCMLWDASRQMCLDVLKIRALERIADKMNEPGYKVEI